MSKLFPESEVAADQTVHVSADLMQTCVHGSPPSKPECNKCTKEVEKSTKRKQRGAA